jgi:hypothetical protein
VASQWVRNSAVEAARDEVGNAASKQAIVEVPLTTLPITRDFAGV